MHTENYIITEEQNKRSEAKLKVLFLRAEGLKAKEISQATGFHPAYVCTIVSKYIMLGYPFSLRRCNSKCHLALMGH